MEAAMNMSGFLAGDFIKAYELPESGFIEAVITDVTEQTFTERGRAKPKPIIYFENGRGLVLNPTRLTVMLDAYGPDSNNWIGQTIRLRRGQTFYEGKPVACVEVEPILSLPRIEDQRGLPPNDNTPPF
jgi:hypothetical protein